MAVDGITGSGGLIGGGTSGNVNVRLDAPVSLLNGGTGVSAFSGTQVANAIGAVPTSGGSMSGNLSLAGGLVVGDPLDGNLGAGTVNIKNFLQIHASPAPITNYADTHLHVEADTGARLMLTSYTGSGSVLSMRMGGGNALAPTATPAGGYLGLLGFFGRSTNDWVWTAGARIAGRSTEIGDWTDGAQGSGLEFETTTAGQVVGQRRVRARVIQGLVVGDPGDGDKGHGSINCESLYVGGAAVGAGTGSLPLSGGTLTGGLVVGNPPDANLGAGTINVQSLLQINASSGVDTTLPGTHFSIVSDDGARLLVTNFGTSGQPVLTFRSAGGTGFSPQPTGDGYVLGMVAFLGRGDSDWSPSARARISGRADQTFTDTAQGACIFFETTPKDTLDTQYVMSIRHDTVWVKGDVDVGGTMVAASDRRLKQNIEPWDKCGLDAVCRLNPISYQYNGLADTVADGKIRVGLDADDTALVIPEMVGERRSCYIEGRPVKTISPGTLTFALINAVKELAARIEALESR